ncbi:hypothetical protein ACFQ2B_40675 [Streptomyces stramineus]
MLGHDDVVLPAGRLGLPVSESGVAQQVLAAFVRGAGGIASEDLEPEDGVCLREQPGARE